MAPPLPAPPPVPAAPPPAGQAVVLAQPLDENLFDPAGIMLVLDDPRLAAVKVEVDREAYPKAAQLLTAALATGVTVEDRRAWLYQLGRLRALGGDPGGAAKAFEETAADGGPLADYARLQAAQWLTGIAQHDTAIANARAIAPDLPIAGAVDLVLADALLGKNDMEGAAKHFRAFLAREKHPPQWVSVALRFATALLQHPSEARAEEAIRLARRVEFEATGGQGAGTAKDLVKQALSTLPSKKRKGFERLSADEQLAKAKSLSASQQMREAVLVTDRLIRMPRAKKASEFACDVWLARSESLAKMRTKKSEAADAFKGAIEHCEGQARRPEALFLGGRASASAGRHQEAIERFAAVEREFHGHRLADDARLRGARAALDEGDVARFTGMLEKIADDYPDGDVAGDGLFELALHYIESGHWELAVAPLERALVRAPHEHAYATSGRLPYFLSRAHIETGAVAKGLAELAAVVRDYPLTYYMGLAYARLSERDRGAAERALATAVAREPEGRFSLTKGPWLEDRRFVRGIELLRQGDAKLAKGELDRFGMSARTAPREVLWTAAFLYARAGVFTQSHNLLRTGTNTDSPQGNELTDWLDHYPRGPFRAAWELAYPRPFTGLVAAEAHREGLPEAWAYAIMREESAFEPRAASPAKAYGLMQLIVPTAQRMGVALNLMPDEESLKRPEINISLGCHYLMVLRRQFPDNALLAIPGYNAGAGAPKKWVSGRPAQDFDVWVERIPYEETRNYTKRVMASISAYDFLYAPGAASEALRSPLSASPAAKAALAAAPPSSDKR